MDFQSDADPAQPFDELSAWIFQSDADPAQTCRVISATQLDRARNHSERRKVGLVFEVSGVSNERNDLQLIHVVQSDDVCWTLSRRDTFKVRLQGVHVGLKAERRLDVATFVPSEQSRSRCQSLRNLERSLVYHLLHVDQSDGDEVSR